jgi:hypothetical protein
MNRYHLQKLYIYILKYGFKVTNVEEASGVYTITLEKWLPPMYEADRFLEEKIVLFPVDRTKL